MAPELNCICRRRLPSGFELDAILRIPLREAPVTVLFGPSGAGKTTLLRVLAGLDRADTGCISLGGHTWYDSARGICLPPQKRRTGFLFQDYALFPHLTVAGNVGYAAPRDRAAELLKVFGIADLAGRMPRAVSGGQRQRVALARALAAGPDLLLLDEPLSALDSQTRSRMRHDLRRMLLDGGVPAIVVTHDRMEAVALGDWMAVIVDGRLRQVGPIQDVFRHPADAQVAASVGVENVLAARIVGREGGLVTISVGERQLQCVDAGETEPPLCASIRAEEVALTRNVPGTSSVRNHLPGRVRSVILEGPLARVELDCGFPFVAVITALSAGELELKPGDEVYAILKATSVHLTAAAGFGSGSSPLR